MRGRSIFIIFRLFAYSLKRQARKLEQKSVGTKRAPVRLFYSPNNRNKRHSLLSLWHSCVADCQQNLRSSHPLAGIGGIVARTLLAYESSSFIWINPLKFFELTSQTTDECKHWTSHEETNELYLTCRFISNIQANKIFYLLVFQMKSRLKWYSIQRTRIFGVSSRKKLIMWRLPLAATS